MNISLENHPKYHPGLVQGPPAKPWIQRIFQHGLLKHLPRENAYQHHLSVEKLVLLLLRRMNPELIPFEQYELNEVKPSVYEMYCAWTRTVRKFPYFKSRTIQGETAIQYQVRSIAGWEWVAINHIVVDQTLSDDQDETFRPLLVFRTRGRILRIARDLLDDDIGLEYELSVMNQ